MNKQVLSIEIREVKESQLDSLVEKFSPNNSKIQYSRYDIQKKGEGLYLIAWDGITPVGLFLLRWSGPRDAAVTKNINITNSAYLEGGETEEGYRRMGVATAIIQEAERLSKEKGCTHIGLEVGINNTNAKRLYEKLNYKEWGFGEFPISWEYVDEKGNKGVETEIVIYMQKKL